MFRGIESPFVGCGYTSSLVGSVWRFLRYKLVKVQWLCKALCAPLAALSCRYAQMLRTSVRLLQDRPKPKKTKSTTRQSVELYQVVRLLLPIGCGAQYAVNIFSMIMIAKTGGKVKLP